MSLRRFGNYGLQGMAIDRDGMVEIGRKRISGNQGEMK